MKILTHSEIDAWVARERAAGHRIGFTCGSFDVLHAGHVQYLAEARRRCDRLLVAVNSDESVRSYKDPRRPINPETERMYIVAGLESVDAVTRMDDVRPLKLIDRWKPDLYIKGGDYAVDSLRSAETVRAYGGTVEVIRPEFETSSTRMFERIALLEAHANPLAAAGRSWRGLALLDRDGTLIRNIPFLHDPAQVELLPGVVEGLKRLQDAGVALAIVSNQQGIGLAYFTVQDFIEVNQALFKQLGPHGIKIARVYFCPHSLAEDCPCRKPAPGMIERALREFAVPAERAFVIGDMAADVEAGAAAGCRTFQVGEADFSRAVAWVLGNLDSADLVLEKDSTLVERWYVAELVMEITVAGASRNVVHCNLFLVSAADPEAAYQKAMDLGGRIESSYDNPQQRNVEHKFRGVAKLDSIVDGTLEDGSELAFTEYIGVPEEQIRQWIGPKEKLGAFFRFDPSRKFDPDYRDGEVMRRLAEALGDRDPPEAN